MQKAIVKFLSNIIILQDMKIELFLKFPKILKVTKSQVYLKRILKEFYEEGDSDGRCFFEIDETGDLIRKKDFDKEKIKIKL